MNSLDVLCEVWHDSAKRLKNLEWKYTIHTGVLIGSIYILRKMSKRISSLECELEELKKEG